MAKRGPPCKVDEVLTDGPWAGMTRGQAACEQRRLGLSHRHCAGAAEVDVATIHRWCEEGGEFATLYARAAAEGARGLRIKAEESREACDLMGRLYGYHHSRVEAEPGEERPQVDAAAVFALLQRLWAEAPHLVEAARAANREPEAVAK